MANPEFYFPVLISNNIIFRCYTDFLNSFTVKLCVVKRSFCCKISLILLTND